MQELERKLRMKETELEGFRKQFSRVCEILQNNVSKIIYQTINSN